MEGRTLQSAFKKIAMRRFPLSPDRFFLVVGLLFGIALVFVTPPFQVPDEPAHFYRAWSVSEGLLVVPGGQSWAGAELPASILYLAGTLMGDIPTHPERKVDPHAILDALEVPLEPDRRTFVAFPNTAMYTFVPYIPQGLTLAAGRALGLTPLVSFYAARLANLLAAVLLIAFAIRQAPAFRWLFALVALTPMAAYQRSSVSADGLTIAAGFVLGALVAKLAWGEEGEDRRRDLALAVVAALILCACKPAYVLLGVALFAIPPSRLPGGRRATALLFYAAHAILLVLVFQASMAHADVSEHLLRHGIGVDPKAQIRDALAEPIRFAGIVAKDYLVHNGDRYLSQLVGQLGWLDTKLPLAFLIVYLMGIAAFGLADGGTLQVEVWQRGILFLAIGGTLGLVAASQYALWTPYGADYIEGLQGRYYLPVVPVGVWMLHIRPWAKRIPAASLGWALTGLTAVSVVVTLAALSRRFYG